MQPTAVFRTFLSPLLATLVSTLVACGGGKPAAAPEGESTGPEPAAESAESGATSDAAEGGGESEDASGGLPTKCFKGTDPCLPPPKFVERLRADTFPAVALHLFSPKAPWTKGYLKGRVKAWNASGGVSDNEAWLEFDEEVVLLRKRGGPQGIQVSGAEGGWEAEWLKL